MVFQGFAVKGKFGRKRTFVSSGEDYSSHRDSKFDHFCYFLLHIPYFSENLILVSKKGKISPDLYWEKIWYVY